MSCSAASLIVRRFFCNHKAMFNIHIASVFGFCKGVEASIETAGKVLDHAGGRPVYSIGRLVHNSRVVDSLSSRGLKIISSPQGYEPGIAVIRAHGITRQLEKEFTDNGFTLVDGTCRIVAANHRICSKSINPVLYFGLKGHAETLSTISCCNTVCHVIENREDLDDIDPECFYEVVMQTTFSSSKAEEFKSAMNEKGIRARFHNSICAASIRRRDSVRRLCGICDTVIVVGDRQSANAKELYNIVISSGLRGYMVSDSSQLRDEMYSGRDIGVCAGASVCPAAVQELVAVLEEKGGIKAANS